MGGGGGVEEVVEVEEGFQSCLRVMVYGMKNMESHFIDPSAIQVTPNTSQLLVQMNPVNLNHSLQQIKTVICNFNKNFRTCTMNLYGSCALLSCI